MEECAELGIKQVWMHRGPGGGSVSREAAEWGRTRGMTVIDGGCPLDVRTDLGRRAQGDALDVQPHRKRPAAASDRPDLSAYAQAVCERCRATQAEAPRCRRLRACGSRLLRVCQMMSSTSGGNRPQPGSACRAPKLTTEPVVQYLRPVANMYRFTGNVTHELGAAAEQRATHRVSWTSFTTNRDH